jgi:hypothetical protein
MDLKIFHSLHFTVKYHACIVIRFTLHYIENSYFLNSVPIVEYNKSHKSNSHLHRVTFTFKYAPSWCLGLYPTIQEIRAKCLGPGCGSWLCISICCKLFAIYALYKGSKRWKPLRATLGMWGSWSTTHQAQCSNQSQVGWQKEAQ